MRVRHFFCLLALLPLACTTDKSGTQKETPNSGGFNLVGEWSGQAKDGTPVRFIFSSNGEAVWFVNDLKFYQMAPSGLRGRYSLRPSFPYHELDIEAFQDPRFANFRLLGILRPMSPSQFILDFLPPPNRHARLKNFTSKAIVLNRRQ